MSIFGFTRRTAGKIVRTANRFGETGRSLDPPAKRRDRWQETQAAGRSILVLAKTTGSPASGEYPVDFYAQGKDKSSTGSGTVEVLNLAITEELPTGTWLVASRSAVMYQEGS